MKKTIMIFCGAFLLCGILGFFAGRDEVSRPPSLVDAAFRGVEARPRLSARLVREECDLVYIFHGRLLYRFDVRSNTLRVRPTSDSEVASLFVQALRRPDEFPINRDTLVILVGGPAGGFALKDVLVSKDPHKIRDVVTGALGGMSGFAVGYKFGTMRQLDYESSEIRAVLDSEDQWRKYKKVYLSRLGIRLYWLSRSIADPKTATVYRTLALRTWERADRAKPEELAPRDFLAALDSLQRSGAPPSPLWPFKL